MLTGCKRCVLSKTRIRQTAYRGNPKSATILVIGESPSATDDVLGKPFTGADSKILDAMIHAAGIPEEKCLFTNAVLCRACDSVNGVNREPTRDELFACLPLVAEIISPLTVDGVIFLGAIAEKYYKNRFGAVQKVTLPPPAMIARKGGKCCNMFTDGTNKLERFYDNIHS